MAIPSGTSVTGNVLTTGNEGGECLITALYQDGALRLSKTVPLIVNDPLPIYDGPVVVAPAGVQKELATKDMILESDITVLGIQYTEELDSDGGVTMTIDASLESE